MRRAAWRIIGVGGKPARRFPSEGWSRRSGQRALLSGSVIPSRTCHGLLASFSPSTHFRRGLLAEGTRRGPIIDAISVVLALTSAVRCAVTIGVDAIGLDDALHTSIARIVDEVGYDRCVGGFILHA